MGHLIIIVGNAGIGKSTLANLLRERMGFTVGLEEQIDHPFQTQFKNNPSLAFINQIDYLLSRAEQERVIRSVKINGIQDGGLEMDWLIFSRLFFEKGWLNVYEMALLHQMYDFIRHLLPSPDLIVHLRAPPRVIFDRFLRRGRTLEIATLNDLERIDALIGEWLACVPDQQVITVDASQDDSSYTSILPSLLEEITNTLKGK